MDKKGTYIVKCSRCGREEMLIEDDMHISLAIKKYCITCGAITIKKRVGWREFLEYREMEELKEFDYQPYEILITKHDDTVSAIIETIRVDSQSKASGILVDAMHEAIPCGIPVFFRVKPEISEDKFFGKKSVFRGRVRFSYWEKDKEARDVSFGEL